MFRSGNILHLVIPAKKQGYLKANLSMISCVLVQVDSSLINVMVISGLKISIKEWIRTSEKKWVLSISQEEAPQPWRILEQTDKSNYTSGFLEKGNTVVPRISLGEFLFEKLSAIRKDVFDKHGLAERSNRLWGFVHICKLFLVTLQ